MSLDNAEQEFNAAKSAALAAIKALNLDSGAIAMPALAALAASVPIPTDASEQEAIFYPDAEFEQTARTIVDKLFNERKRAIGKLIQSTLNQNSTYMGLGSVRIPLPAEDNAFRMPLFEYVDECNKTYPHLPVSWKANCSHIELELDIPTWLKHLRKNNVSVPVPVPSSASSSASAYTFVCHPPSPAPSTPVVTIPFKGMACICPDKQNNLFDAVVIAVSDDGRVDVHYTYWSKHSDETRRMDEIIARDLPVTGEVKLSKGDRVSYAFGWDHFQGTVTNVEGSLFRAQFDEGEKKKPQWFKADDCRIKKI